MLSKDLIRLYTSKDIPLADTKEIIDFYFGLDFDRSETDTREMDDKEAYSVLERLKQGEPSAYITGYIISDGVKINLNRSTLIPRIETEEFVFETLYKEDLSDKKVLDLCTGSGFIAMLIKHRFPSCDVTASDISDDCLSIAERSALENNLDIGFVRSDYLKDIEGRFDVIVSNPPYIGENEEVDAPFEPPLALYAGKEGLDSYVSIFKDLRKHVNVNSKCYFELGVNSQKVYSLAKETFPEADIRFIKDLENKNRYLAICFDRS